MTGVDHDRELRSTFAVLADSLTPYIRPPGADLALHAARRRIRNRRLAMAAAVALVVLIPAGVVALGRGPGSTSLPMPPATSGPTASPTPTESSTPTNAPPTPSVEPSVVAEPTPGPGELLNATLTLSWDNAQADELCGGSVTIVDDWSGLKVQSTMPFDVDRDGDVEIVAHVHCHTGEVGPQKLLAVQLGPSGASIVGTVLATDWALGDDRALGAPQAIRGYVGLSDGSIRVDVANAATCCGTPAQSAVVQQRD